MKSEQEYNQKVRKIKKAIRRQRSRHPATPGERFLPIIETLGISASFQDRRKLIRLENNYQGLLPDYTGPQAFELTFWLIILKEDVRDQTRIDQAQLLIPRAESPIEKRKPVPVKSH